jgi:MFS family permease
MGIPGALAATKDKAGAFFRRIPRDWTVTASRTSIYRFFYQMTLPYISVYTIGLGATGADLGLVNCVGMLFAAFLAPYTGTLMDRIGPKRIYLISIVFLSLSWLVYGLAWTWPVIIFAMILYYIGFRTSLHCCGGICASCLDSADRATAMSICETLAAGFLGIVGPLVGAFIVGLSGRGTSVGAIRPLFFLSFLGNAATFLLVGKRMSNTRWGAADAKRTPFFADIRETMKHGRYLKRFMVVSVVSALPMGMIIPFAQPYAAQHGASGFVLGAMVTGFAVTPMLLGIPIGRLADRMGKKRVIFLVSPVFWLSCMLLLVARSGPVFILAGVLQGSLNIFSVVQAALQFELTEPGYVGRWLGVLGFFQMLAMALAALLSGFVWDKIGPQYVFIIPVVLDILVRMPLLAGIKEKRIVPAEAGGEAR